MNISIEEILSILPHRYPFLLVDKIINIDIEKLEGEFQKNVSFNESFFQGHFPQRPIMPGVLIIEALAQASILTIVKSVEASEKSRFGIEDSYAIRNDLFFLAKIDNVKFKKPVLPGDILIMKIKVLNFKRINGKSIAKLSCQAFVGSELYTECEIMASSS